MTHSPARVTTFDPEALNRLMADAKVWSVDVREPAEYAVERIPGASLCPLSSFAPGALPHDQSRSLVFHCAGGKRSLAAAQRLLAAGVSDATHLGGGIAAWKAAGLPVINSAG